MISKLPFPFQFDRSHPITSVLTPVPLFFGTSCPSLHPSLQLSTNRWSTQGLSEHARRVQSNSDESKPPSGAHAMQIDQAGTGCGGGEGGGMAARMPTTAAVKMTHTRARAHTHTHTHTLESGTHPQAVSVFPFSVCAHVCAFIKTLVHTWDR